MANVLDLIIKISASGTPEVSNAIKGVAADLVSLAAAGLTVAAAADAWVKYDAAIRDTANLTGAALGDMKALILDSSVTMGRFAAEAAGAFGVVGSKLPALLDFPDVLKAVADQSLELADAAKATGDAMTDADAAAAITAGLNQWGVATADASKEADRFGNILAAGAKFGSASISSMVASMRDSGTVAAQAGIKFEEYAATLQVLGGKQIEASMAGTALRNVISYLSTKDLKEFGISGVEATLKTKGLEAALTMLKPILANDSAMVKIFGQENLTAGKVLVSNAAAIGDMKDKLTGTNTAYEQAQAGLATFSKQMEIAGGMMKTIAAFSIDEVLGPAITPSLMEFNALLKEVFLNLQAFSESETFAALGDEVLIWRDNAEAFIPLIEAIASGWLQAWEAANQLPAALDSIGVSLEWFGGNTTLVGLFADAYNEIVHADTALQALLAIGIAESQALGNVFMGVWYDGQIVAAEVLRKIGNWLNDINIALADMRAGMARSMRDLMDGAAGMATSLAALPGGQKFADMTEGINAARDGMAQWAIESIQGAKAARAEQVNFNNAIDDQIKGYQEKKALLDVNTQEARMLTENALAAHNEALARTDSMRAKAAYGRETDKAIAAAEKENAALMNVKTATDGAGKGMGAMAAATDKAKGKLDEAAKAAQKAAEDVQRLWDALAKETAMIGLSDAEKKAWDLAEAMRKTGEYTQEQITAATAEYTAQVDLNAEFEKAVKLQEDMVKAYDERQAKQAKSLLDLQKEVEYAGMASDKERERAKFLADYDENNRAAAAALYDQKKAVEEQNSAWQSIKDSAMSFFDEVIKTGEFSWKKLWTSFKGIAIKSLMDSLTSGKGILSNLSGAWSSLTGMFSGGGTASASAGGTAAAGGGGLLSGLGSIGSAISGFFGGGSAAAGGGLLGSLGGLASMASAAMPIIGGIMAIPQIGKLLTGTWGTKGLFASGDIMGGDFSIGRTREKKGLLSKKSKRETFDPTQGGFEDVRDALEGTWSTLDSFKGEMLKLAGGIGQAFGKDITGEFQNQFKATLNIDASGEDFSKQLNKWLQDTTGQALKTALDLALAGDSSQFAATIRELTGAAGEDVNKVTELVNGLFSLKSQMSVLTLDTELLTPALISASGGIEQLQGSLNFFYEQFYTDTERAAAQLDSANTALASGFAELGLAVPETRAEFRALVESLKATTGGADETLAGLLKLAGSADLVFDAAEAAAPALEDTAEALQNVNTAAETLTAGQQAYMNQAGVLPQISQEAYDAMVYGLVPAIEETKETALQATEDLSAAFIKWRDAFGLLSPLQQAQEWVMGLGISADQFAQQVRGVSFEQFQGIAAGLGVSTDELMRAVDETYGALQRAADGTDSLENSAAALAVTAESTARSLAEIDRDLAGALESNMGNAMSALQESVNAEKDRLAGNLEAQKNALDTQLQQELDSLSAAHDWRMKALEAEKAAAQDNAQKFRAIADSLSQAVDGLGVQSEAAALATRRNAQAQLKDWAARGVLPDQAQLDKALGGLGGDSARFFGSFEDYVRDTVRTAADVGSLAANAEKQATDAERMLAAYDSMAAAEVAQFEAGQTAAQARHDEAIELATAQYEADIAGLEQTLTDAEKQYNALMGIDNGILTVADAVNGVQTALGLYSEAIASGLQIQQDETAGLQGQIAGLMAERAAMVAETAPKAEILPGIMTTAAAAVEDVAPEEITRLSNWTGVPAFASGGTHTGGLAIVGENGPELVNLPPSTIQSNSASRLSFDELIAEIKALRADLQAGNHAVAKNTGRSADLLQRWEGAGLPETRA